MPYKEPQKRKEGWVLPKKKGGYHRSRAGKIVYFRSKEAAKKAAHYINAVEHGFKPTRK